MDAKLITLLQSLMKDFDSTIDTSEQSSFYQSVLTPLLTRAGGDPLDTNLEEFLVSYMKERYPDLNTTNSSSFRNFLIRPLTVLMEPLRRELSELRKAQSLNNVSEMTSDELNLLLGNFFLSQNTGTFATGTIRVFFSSPTTISITPGTSFETPEGLRFFPSATVTIDRGTMAFNYNTLQNLFFVDVEVVAEFAGTTHNVGENTVTVFNNIENVTAIANTAAMTGGSNAETATEAVTRAKTSISTQNLLTERGIRLVLLQNYPLIEDVFVSGFGDEFMQRDIISGPATISGVPGGFYTTNTNILSSSNEVHVGGKTDIYIFDGSQTSETIPTLTISNLTDRGEYTFEGHSGYTIAAQSNNIQSFYDKNAHFNTLDLDLTNETYNLHYESQVFQIQSIDSSGDFVVIVTSSTNSIPANSSSLAYEIRRVSSDMRARITLSDLAAFTSAGELVVSGTSPVFPAPGSKTLTANAANTASTTNIARGNIQTPFTKVTNLSLGVGSGNYSNVGNVPEVLLGPFYARDITAGDGSNHHGIGSVRVYSSTRINILAVATHQNTDEDTSATYNNKNPRIIHYDNYIENTDGTVNAASTIFGRFFGPLLQVNGETFGIRPVCSANTQDPFAHSANLQGFIAVYSSAPTDDFIYINENQFGGAFTEPKAGMWIYIDDNSTTVKTEIHKKCFQISAITKLSSSDTASLSGGPWFKCTVRTGSSSVIFQPSSSYSPSNAALVTIQLHQGCLASNMTFDDAKQLFYVDFLIFGLANNTSAVADSENKLMTSFTNTGDRGKADFYGEGFKVRTTNKGHGFSSREEPELILSNFLTADNGTTVTSYGQIIDKSGTALQAVLSYKKQTTVNTVQTFVSSDDNRIVAEDILVKRFVPVFLQGRIRGVGLTEANGAVAISTFFDELPSSSTLIISDLLQYLHSQGASRIELPLELIAYRYDQNRNVTIEVVVDTLTLKKNERFFISSIIYEVIT